MPYKMSEQDASDFELIRTPLFPQRIASCSSSPTTNPAQSKDGVSSANHRSTSVLHDGGRMCARFWPERRSESDMLAYRAVWEVAVS